MAARGCVCEVVETGNDKFAAEINCLFGIKLFSQAAITGCHDQSVSDDQGVDQREGFVSYENFAVGQNEISGLAAPIGSDSCPPQAVRKSE